MTTPDLRTLLAAAERAIKARQQLGGPEMTLDLAKELVFELRAYEEKADPTTVAAIVRELMARREHDTKPCGDAVAHANDARTT